MKRFAPWLFPLFALATLAEADGFHPSAETRLTASDGAEGDLFGVGLAASGTTALVGAWRHNAKTGAAYLFDMTNGAEIAKLTASDAKVGDSLGVRVALSDTVALVGANYGDGRVEDTGAVYVFDPTTRIETAKLVALDGQKEDRFGVSIALSGNLALIGADFGDGNAKDSGAAYLFDIRAGRQILKLTAHDGATGDKFGGGRGAAISGGTALVGAWQHDSGQGAAYLFDTTTGEQVAKLVASDGAVGDAFGISVALSGTTAVIGSYQDDDKGAESGSVYLFNTETGEEIAKLTADDGKHYTRFGSDVAIHGSTVIVGSSGGQDPGAVYLFDATSGDQIGRLSELDDPGYDGFGHSVAVTDAAILVGSIYADFGDGYTGAAYVYSRAAVQDSTPLRTALILLALAGLLTTFLLRRRGQQGR